MACLHSCRRQSAGGSLIEVLVSVLVLSIGLLGASALQVTGLRNNQSNYEHAQMTVLTQSMLDAMRNNLAGVEAGEYEIATWTCAAPAGPRWPQTTWRNGSTAFRRRSTPACGRITCAGRDCSVGIRWDDSRATGGSDTQAFEIRSRL